MTTPTTTEITLSWSQIDRIAELLEITGTFLRRRLPTIGGELDTLLREHHISAGPSWLIDMLGLVALQLRMAADATACGAGDE